MHLPDGVITQTAPILALNATGILGSLVALTRVAKTERTSAAWTGTMAAFLLVAQALNVPVWLGTSAHCMGAGLVTLALGPLAAVISISSVVLAQALLFGDGGISVLGINLLNIAIVPVLCTELLWRLLGEKSSRLALTAILSVPLGNALSAGILSLVLVSGAHAPAAPTLGWLVGLQTLAGVVEGFLTAFAIRWLEPRAPEIFRREAREGAPRRRLAVLATAGVVCLAAGAALATGVLPLKSNAPDALERVVEHLHTP